MDPTLSLTETNPDLISPAIARACSRCHDRKVKCDLRVPHCGSCRRQEIACDLTERVTYSYAVVRSLHNKIQHLEARLRLTQTDPRQHLSEPTGAIQNEEAHLQQAEDQRDEDTLGFPATESAEAFAEEVGNLVVAADASVLHYVGSAAGASFARIFFHQIQMPLSDILASQGCELGTPFSPADPVTVMQAGLPPSRIAKYLLARYVGRMHVYWPVLHLPTLRSWFKDAYTIPRSLSPYHKCVIFLVLALGAYASKDDSQYRKLLDVNTPAEYLSTALRYYEHISGTPNLQILQVLNLLILCMAFSCDVCHNSSLWHMSRFAMSIAIQLGCHRHNPRWRFSAAEVEMRNRVWWCTYGLERTISVATGRTLSMRNHAIDAPFPQITADDELTEAEAAISPTLHMKSVMPAVHLFRLRRIAGDILESVYVARPKRGVSLSLNTVRNMAEHLSQSLDRWLVELGESTLANSNEHLELQIEHGLIALLLKRPSPVFPSPTIQAIESCAEISRTVLESWAELDVRNERTQTWLTFHDMLLTGMTWLYSRWKTHVTDHSTTENVADICSRLLSSASRGEQKLLKYVGFFNRLKEVVLAHSRENEQTFPARLTAGENGLFDELDLDWTDMNFDEIFTGMDLGSQIDISMDAWSSSLFVS